MMEVRNLSVEFSELHPTLLQLSINKYRIHEYRIFEFNVMLCNIHVEPIPMIAEIYHPHYDLSTGDCN